MIVALSFVPDKFIVKEFQDPLDYFLNSNVDACLIDLLFWFEKNFIKDLVYKITFDFDTLLTIWSAYINVLNDFPRTTNSLEGWHRSLNNNDTHKNPSSYEIFSIIQFEQNLIEIKILKVNGML
jgi:hypothetical protein